MIIPNYPSILQFQQLVERKDYRAHPEGIRPLRARVELSMLIQIPGARTPAKANCLRSAFPGSSGFAWLAELSGICDALWIVVIVQCPVASVALHAGLKTVHYCLCQRNRAPLLGLVAGNAANG